jgi:vacuolar-type H+-ATPase subunit B/Vma2
VGATCGRAPPPVDGRLGDGGVHDGSHRADEVEAKVQLVMDSKEGRKLRARVAMRREEAMTALEDDMWGHELVPKSTIHPQNTLFQS